MSDLASKSDAVVIHGPRGIHFEDEVLSWHNINGTPAGQILPAILITTRNPHTFREVYGPSSALRAPADALVLIPLKQVCTTPAEVVSLIDRIFRDLAEGKGLADFEVAKQMRAGVRGAFVDALVLQPRFGGVGIDLKKVAQLFRPSRNRKPDR